MEFSALTTIAQAVPAAPGSELAQYGILGVVSMLFLWAVVALYNRGEKRQIAFDADRKTWDTERTTSLANQITERMKLTADLEKLRSDLRAEYEAKHRELVENYSEALRAERDQNRAHEDEARKEFAELMEEVAEKQSLSSAALTTVMEKFFSRFVGPNARRHY